MINQRYIAVFSLGVLLFLFSCGDGSKQTEIKTVKTDSIPSFMLKRENLNKEISFPGELSPLERAEIFAKVSGYIKTINVEMGDKVRQGQVIAVLDAPEMVANYAQANSELQAARSKYTGSLDAYRRILDAAKVPGTMAQGEIEKSKNLMMSDSAAYEATKAKSNAYGQLKEYLSIRAPFTGIITQRNIDPGTLVGNQNAKPMFVVENNNTLRLRLPVPEAYTSASLEGNAVKFTSDAFPAEVFEAELARKAGAINLSNRTETWEFLYDNKGGKLKSGMFANVSIKFERTNPSFVVPATAVVTSLEKRFVIRMKNGIAEWVDVRNGITVGDRVEIFGSLEEGDILLLRGSDEIKPGNKLIPKI